MITIQGHSFPFSLDFHCWWSSLLHESSSAGRPGVARFPIQGTCSEHYNEQAVSSKLLLVLTRGTGKPASPTKQSPRDRDQYCSSLLYRKELGPQHQQTQSTSVRKDGSHSPGRVTKAAKSLRVRVTKKGWVK